MVAIRIFICGYSFYWSQDEFCWIQVTVVRRKFQDHVHERRLFDLPHYFPTLVILRQMKQLRLCVRGIVRDDVRCEPLDDVTLYCASIRRFFYHCGAIRCIIYDN